MPPTSGRCSPRARRRHLLSPSTIRMNTEAGGLRAELELLGVEVQPRLDVRAAHGQHRTTGKVARHHAMDVAADDATHLRVAPHDVSKPRRQSRAEDRGRPRQDAGEDRRMMHRDDRQEAPAPPPVLVEPAEPPAVKTTGSAPGRVLSSTTRRNGTRGRTSTAPARRRRPVPRSADAGRGDRRGSRAARRSARRVSRGARARPRTRHRLRGRRGHRTRARRQADQARAPTRLPRRTAQSDRPLPSQHRCGGHSAERGGTVGSTCAAR